MNANVGKTTTGGVTQNPVMEARWRMFETLRPHVGAVVQSIRQLSDAQMSDAAFLEREFIPFVGLNDENLHEQPPELSSSYGTGLHLWQYPKQFASYLAWIAKNARGVRGYAEIGSRWGGTAITVVEWLRRFNPELSTILCVDLIAKTPFLQEYETRWLDRPEQSPIQLAYLKNSSLTQTSAALFQNMRPDFVFIDGDHTIPVALYEHMLVRDFARYIVHHDVASDVCETRHLWGWLKRLESTTFDCEEFVQQYASVPGSYIGFGVLSRHA